MSCYLELSKRQGTIGITCVNHPVKGRQGALVSGLVEDSVALQAGLHVGDIITAVNDRPVHGHQDCIELIDQEPDDLSFIVESTQPRLLTTWVSRPDLPCCPCTSRHTLSIPIPSLFSGPTRLCLIDKAFGRLGITCRNTHDGLGVEISGLESDSIAPEHGMCVGDTLLSVNGQLCESVRIDPRRPRRGRRPRDSYPAQYERQRSPLPPPSLAPQHQHAISLIDASPILELVLTADTRPVCIETAWVGRKLGVTVANHFNGQSGVVVIGLESGGLAAQHLSLGDVILSVNNELVGDHTRAVDLLDSNQGEVHLLLGPPAANLDALIDEASKPRRFVRPSSALLRRSSQQSASLDCSEFVDLCKPRLTLHNVTLHEEAPAERDDYDDGN